MGFQALHAAVLGLSFINISFEKQLSLVSRDEIDQRDSIGRTALSWASQRGDIKVVEKLLMKGADPNAADFEGVTPLLWCANDVKCLNALLEAGAFVNSVNPMGASKLQVIIANLNDTILLDIFWKHGVNLNHKGFQKSTALHIAADFDRVHAMRWLIQKDLSIDVCTVYGQTPLLRAISHKACRSLKILLDNGADYRIKDINHEGLPHTVARNGDLSVISLLRQTSLSGLDIDEKGLCGWSVYEKSPHGKTAMELAEWRRDHNIEWSLTCTELPDADPMEWFRAFEDLVDSIRAADVADYFESFWTSLDMNESRDDHLETTARSHSGERTLKEPGLIPGQCVGRTLPGSYTSRDGDKA